jgi:hypothetical protein
MPALDNLHYKPLWTSHLGCVKGCLDYLGLDVTEAWLFGATGHAFVINIHDLVCPSGPTAWNTAGLFALGRNAGYTIDGVQAHKSQPDFADKQRLAWDKTRQAIDKGFPCYGWELQIPEYYLVSGYDRTAYLFTGPACDQASGRKVWDELGNTGIGMLEMYQVRPGAPVGDRRTVREALAFALEHAGSPKKWILPRYRSGLGGYENWIASLRAGTADSHGAAYNAAVWCECRGFAVEFLEQAKQRIGELGDGLFAQAGEHYRQVHAQLERVSELFPFRGMRPEHVKDPQRVGAALEALESARQAEASGLQALEKLVAVL